MALVNSISLFAMPLGMHIPDQEISTMAYLFHSKKLVLSEQTRKEMVQGLEASGKYHHFVQ